MSEKASSEKASSGKVSADVIAALNYVRLFAGTKIVVKLGGSVLQDDEVLRLLCEDLAAIRKVGVSIIAVHGGGPAINAELERRGIKWSFHEGQRVTSPEMMAVIEATLCGSVNRRVVRGLYAAGLKAVGLSGADAGTLVCKAADPRLGQVGLIERVNGALIDFTLAMQDELGARGIPVIAPVGVGRDGKAYNINADWVASRVASHYGVAKMVFLTDQDGILGPDGKLIPEIDAGELEQMIEDGSVRDGMLAKARTIQHALQNGVTDVHVINARRPGALIEELFTEKGSGTICRLRSRGGS
jgi:acetylglutamate kinase